MNHNLFFLFYIMTYILSYIIELNHLYLLYFVLTKSKRQNIAFPFDRFLFYFIGNCKRTASSKRATVAEIKQQPSILFFIFVARLAQQQERRRVAALLRIATREMHMQPGKW